MRTDAHNMGRDERRALLEERRAAVVRQMRCLAIELTDLDSSLTRSSSWSLDESAIAGFCTPAGTQLSDRASAIEKKVARRWVKPRPIKLLGGQLVAVDENQSARVERHRPSPRRANHMVLTDIYYMPREIAEILKHSAADLTVRPRIHTHPHIHRQAAVAGITGRPASALRPSFHPSSP